MLNMRQKQALTQTIKNRYQSANKKEKGRILDELIATNPEKPREVVQMDTIDFGGLFAFTAVDCFSRKADIFLTPELNSQYGFKFLEQSMTRRFDNWSDLIQTDGGPEFKDQFSAHVKEYCNRHRISRPYKKKGQSFIESFNRSVRKECFGWQKYNPDQLSECNQMIESFLERYHHHRPHVEFGMKPPLLKLK